jgi:transposase
MLAEGIEIYKVASIIGKSIETIENRHRQYRGKGIESLNFLQYKPKQSYLNDEQIKQLVSWVKTSNPAKLKQIRQYIIDHFKVKYTTEAIRKLLHKKGLKKKIISFLCVFSVSACPTCPVKYLLSEISVHFTGAESISRERSLFNRRVANLTGIKSLLHLFHRAGETKLILLHNLILPIRRLHRLPQINDC